ncbi:hypothetical protein [Paenibacillus ihuae]|uniref:hypothetical protein n=1 Tax=Paenibacillus ihuae TaxID=1232431 RepID=UPI0006D5A4EF|nr:hypothetical protein [Paenibacillus ihuae]
MDKVKVIQAPKFHREASGKTYDLPDNMIHKQGSIRLRLQTGQPDIQAFVQEIKTERYHHSG